MGGCASQTHVFAVLMCDCVQCVQYSKSVSECPCRSLRCMIFTNGCIYKVRFANSSNSLQKLEMKQIRISKYIFINSKCFFKTTIRRFAVSVSAAQLHPRLGFVYASRIVPNFMFHAKETCDTIV